MKKGDFCSLVENPSWVGRLIRFDEVPGLWELHGVDFYALRILNNPLNECICEDDKRWFTEMDLILIWDRDNIEIPPDAEKYGDGLPF